MTMSAQLQPHSPGKHGHAKVLLVVLDIFTDKKVSLPVASLGFSLINDDLFLTQMELVAPARANLLVPVVKKNDLLLVS